MSQQSTEPAEKKKKLLVVEDDEFIRKALSKTLEASGYEVRVAENGLVAKTIFELSEGGLDLIVSDIRMPELDGLSLLQFVRKTSKVPFVLMTGFAEIIETKDAYAMGANEFVAKPFRPGDLLEAISNCLNPTPAKKPGKAQPAEKAQEFCSIHINDFLSTSTLLSDIYVKLSNTKYIRVAYRGEDIPVERLNTYLQKKVEFLYVTLPDFAAYVNFTVKVASAAMGNQDLSTEKKARVLKHTTEVLVGRCFLGELNPDFVLPAQKMVEDSIKLVSMDADIIDIFSDLATQSDRLFSQAVAVAVYACLVARLHGWSSPTTQFKIVLGGLLHDIGWREIDPKILRKKRMSRSAEETKLIESHATRGRDLVLLLNKLPEDISVIVYQHHETPNGTGFPQALPAVKIHPIALLIGTVDRFIQLTMPLEEGVEKLTPMQAIAQLRNHYLGECDQGYVDRLEEIFSMSRATGAA